MIVSGVPKYKDYFADNPLGFIGRHAYLLIDEQRELIGCITSTHHDGTLEFCTYPRNGEGTVGAIRMYLLGGVVSKIEVCGPLRGWLRRRMGFSFSYQLLYRHEAYIAALTILLFRQWLSRDVRGIIARLVYNSFDNDCWAHR